MQTPPDRQVVPVILGDAVLVAWLPAQHVAWRDASLQSVDPLA